MHKRHQVGSNVYAPPKAPVLLPPTSLDSSSIAVGIIPAQNDGAGISVYIYEQSLNGISGWNVIATALADSIIDTGLTASTTYFYRVKARDNRGLLSSYTNIQAAITPSAGDVAAPSTPLSPTAIAVSTIEIDVSWLASTDNIGVALYRLQKSNDGLTGWTDAQVADALSFADVGMSQATLRYYRVRAEDAAGNFSGWSSIVSDTTFNVIQGFLTLVQPVAVNSGTIVVGVIPPVSDGTDLSAFVYEFSLDGTTNWTVFATTIATNTTHSNLNASTTYYYRAKARDVLDQESAYSSVLFVTTPAATFTAPTIVELQTVGYIVVTEPPYNADKNFVNDSTLAIQAALDAGKAAGKPVWFPYGTYKISAPLRCYTWQVWNTATLASGNPVAGYHCLQGEYRANGQRPTIKLAASAPFFDNVATLAPMIGFRNYKAIDAGGLTIPVNLPVNPFDLPSNFTYGEGDLYHGSVRGIDFDTNGHAGAVGFHCPGAQYFAIERVKVTATGSYACFSALPTADSPNVNIDGVGGQYGLAPALFSKSQGAQSGIGLSVTAARFTGQTVQVLVADDDVVAPCYVGCEFSPAGAGVVWKPTVALTSTSHGPAAFIDCNISQPAGIVFDNSTGGKSLYVRNTYITGTTQLIKFSTNTTILGSGTWSCINEYSALDQRGTPPYPAYSGAFFATFKNYNLVTSDGALTTTSEKVKNITQNSGAPPATLSTRHYLSPFDIIDSGKYVKVTDFGASRATGATVRDYLDITPVYALTGQPDSLAGFNAAIAAAETAGHNRVLVPFGTYFLSNTLTLRKDTHLFGLAHRSSNIAVHESWHPTTGNPILIDTIADTEGMASISNMIISVPQIRGSLVSNAYTENRFSHIRWRVGRKSNTFWIFAALQFDLSSHVAPAAKISLDITSTGGGRHYGFIAASNWDTQHLDNRVVRMTGTSQALAFYGCNPETGKKSASGTTGLCAYEVNGSSNIRLYQLKREGRQNTLFIINSSNIALYGHGGNFMPNPTSTPASYIDIDSASTNILIALATVGQQTTATDQNKPILTDHGTGIVVNSPEGLSLYKKGTIDDTVMVFT